ncbi:MAG: cytochrome-c peroxidase [Alteromonadaceae bacterium]|nr:MAG: cytochrome-c peroxidase [Alteromonadaceae bacterium]
MNCHYLKINTALKAVAIMVAGLSFSPSVMADADIDPPLAALGPVPIPPDNEMTPEKIELGKLLYWDGRLGGDGSMPCAACHAPELGWGYPSSISRGYPGTVHWRNSQTLINSAYYGKLFWAGGSNSLEHQARGAAKGGVAGNGESNVMEAQLGLVPEYRERFEEVFGSGLPKVENAWEAIAAFERTLVQRDTPFDLAQTDASKSLTAEQQRGQVLFEGKANCLECHNGALVSDEQYYNLGVPSNKQWETSGLAQITFRFELYAKGVTEALYRETKRDLGFYFRTKQKRDKGKFRTPSLRYVKYTAPYMHNGTLATLDDVIEFYNQGGGEDAFDTKTSILKPLNLTESEKRDLKAFVLSFSGDEILMQKPELPPSRALNYFEVANSHIDKKSNKN